MTSLNSGEWPALDGKVLCLGVTGAIPAYKAAALCSALSKQRAEVNVFMTRAALRFVGELTFETLSHRPVITELFSRSTEYDPQHIALARRVDAVILAPATANIIAKMAQGIADDALSTALLAFTCPVFVAPAMNRRMWRHPATEKNVAVLKERGVIFIGPNSGPLACRDEDGPGRMSEPDEILDRVGEFFSLQEKTEK